MDIDDFEIVEEVDMAARCMGHTEPGAKYGHGAAVTGAAASVHHTDAVITLCPVLERGATREQLIARMRVTETEARRVESYEQGTEPWYLSRRGSQTRLPDGVMFSDRLRSKSEAPDRQITFVPGRLTASNFGTAAGHNKYTPPEELVKDMLWGIVVSNDAMRYGTEMEPVACDVFQWAMFFLTGGGIDIEHRGLMLACPGVMEQEGAGGEPVYEGWCGTSPDGIVHYSPLPAQHTAPEISRTSQTIHPPPDFSALPCPPTKLAAALASRPRTDARSGVSLLEIKCPSVNKRTFYSERRGNERFGIPHYYYDQIQGIMGLQGIGDAFFVVHLPHATQISWYMFSPEYYATLFASMRSFWFDLYLPAALACAHGKLVEGETEVREAVARRLTREGCEEGAGIVVADPADKVRDLLLRTC
jgi:hypothetical protein